MPSEELTAPAEWSEAVALADADRREGFARFALAAQAHGKLKYADLETRHLMRAFAKARRRPAARFTGWLRARAPRRRSIRSSSAKARAPADPSEPEPPDLEPALRVISRAEWRRELERAGL
jgi:hypothetical protein